MAKMPMFLGKKPMQEEKGMKGKPPYAKGKMADKKAGKPKKK